MSEPSDFHDWSEAEESSSPKEPFDPVEHFESLNEGEAEPLKTETNKLASEPVAKPISSSKVPSAVPRTSDHPSLIRGIALAVVGSGLLIGLGVIGSRPVTTSSTPTPETKPSETKVAEGSVPTPESTPPVTTIAASVPEPIGTDAKPSVEPVHSDHEGFTKRLDELQKQFASMPKPVAVPDLKPLEAKVEGLAKRIEASPVPAPDTKGLEEKIEKATSTQAELTDKLNTLTTQLGNLEKALAAEKSEVATLQAKIKTLSEVKSKPEPALSTAVTTTAPTPAAANTEADFSKAADLFKKLQFAQANDLFAKLQESAPNDARVWYYSAMANGFTTTQWTGETVRLVKKGMELEKAGTPDVDKINAAFADLPVSSKGWLDAYRAQIIR